MENTARKAIRILALPFWVCLLATQIQSQTTAQERAIRLREQLVAVLAKEEESQTRLAQLEEDLKPENIEKSLAGIGSTRPEDLRELRRRQLDLERLSVQNQLRQLSESRTRLETAIVQADAAAYHQSATENLEKSGTQEQADSSRNVQRPRRTGQSPPRARRIRRPIYQGNSHR